MRDRARREVVWSGLLEGVRGMLERLQSQQEETVMDEVRRLEHEVDAKWKGSGGQVMEDESEDAAELDRSDR